MSDTERLDFILDTSAHVYQNLLGEWVCFVHNELIGIGKTAREVIDVAIKKAARKPPDDTLNYDET